MGRSMLPCPDYGIDAPGVVRNLFLVGVAEFMVWATAALGFWSGKLWGMPFAAVCLGGALGFAAMGCFMLWSSKVGKLRERDRLLDLIAWKGDETVLDVGCGRGLMLLGAAKRLSTGKAVGIDLWQAEDLTGNCAEATRENARREGVAECVEVHTGDMRKLPFPDESFDVIVSPWAVHNVYSARDRQQALGEMVRVLRPGGQVILADIQHLAEYAAFFGQRGLGDIRVICPWWKPLLAVITFGNFGPAAVVARKKTTEPFGEPHGDSPPRSVSQNLV